MSMLKSIPSHLTCSFYIQRYLEGESKDRALDKDFIYLYSEHDRDNWAQVMDATRQMCGNDASWGGKEAVTYRHFIVSPDPKDGVDLATLKSLTMQWAQEMFGNNDAECVPGRLGLYQAAIVYHDDNDKGIMHAHIVVNCTHLTLGRRLHISNDDSDMMADRLQEISKEHGLSCFDNDLSKSKRLTRGSYLTRTERGLIKAEHFSWKEDLRDKIKISRRLSKDESGFIKRLDMLGVKAEKITRFTLVPKNGQTYTPEEHEALLEKLSEVSDHAAMFEGGFEAVARNEGELADIHTTAKLLGLTCDVKSQDYLYAHSKNPTRWKAYGYRLGRNYMLDDIAYMRDVAVAEGRVPSADTTQKIDAFIERVGFETIAHIEGDTTIKDVACLLQINDRHRISCDADYDKLLRTYAIKIKHAGKAESAHLESYKSAYRDVKKAKETAEAIGIFEGKEKPAGSRKRIRSAVETGGSKSTQRNLNTSSVRSPKRGVTPKKAQPKRQP